MAQQSTVTTPDFSPPPQYPFGMVQPGRSFTSGDGYRYGMNKQEKVDEISGSGNHYTAMFWEYDPRSGRRWNQDPKPNPSISNYAAFANNPILYNDILGDTISLGSGTSDNPGFQSWQNSRAGKRFYKRYDIGGKRESVNVQINFADNGIRTPRGSIRGGVSGQTSIIIKGQGGGPNSLVSKEYYQNMVDNNQAVSGFTHTIGAKDKVGYKIEFTNSASKIETGADILHETHHVRIFDFSLLMTGNPNSYSTNEHHKFMLNNLRSSGTKVRLLKSKYSMPNGNGIFDFNAEMWDYLDEHRSPSDTDEKIDNKTFQSQKSDLPD